MPHVNDTENSLPLQVFIFSGNKQHIPYENLRSEFFEHLRAIIIGFGLKIFQYPAGDDFLQN
jgi:miniconductance mechanosensitive channel